MHILQMRKLRTKSKDTHTLQVSKIPRRAGSSQMGQSPQRDPPQGAILPENPLYLGRGCHHLILVLPTCGICLPYVLVLDSLLLLCVWSYAFHLRVCLHIFLPETTSFFFLR